MPFGLFRFIFRSALNREAEKRRQENGKILREKLQASHDRLEQELNQLERKPQQGNASQ